MIIQDIDKGQPFEWGKTSEDYAKYRDIYRFCYRDWINSAAAKQLHISQPSLSAALKVLHTFWVWEVV